MKSRSNYTIRVFHDDETITISTLSPSGQYFFKIKEPRDMYWGLFCSPIVFFDVQNNLIYYEQHQYAQFGLTPCMPWDIVSWSKSGKIAYFIERNSVKNCSHVFVDLENKKVSKTEYKDIDKENLANELFIKLSRDEAYEIYYKIITTPIEKKNEIVEYLLSLNLIDDKKELMRLVENYFFSETKQILQQVLDGNFEDTITTYKFFNDFIEFKPDKIKLSILEYFGRLTWKPA